MYMKCSSHHTTQDLALHIMNDVHYIFSVIRCHKENHGQLAAMAALEQRVLSVELSKSAGALQQDLAARNTVLLCAVDTTTSQVLGFLVYFCNSVNVHINKLLVASEARRCGVASMLLKACLIAAITQRKSQCSSLHVSTTNAPALALYRKAGYICDELVKDHYGSQRDAYRMICELQQSAAMQAFLNAS